MESGQPDSFIKIAVLDSAVESQLVCSILDERNIAYIAKSYHDTAYDGLFQVQKGWGEVCAPIVHQDEILEIIHDVRGKNF
ncbi:MAG: hypothetical protein ABIK15_13195 [Pseudomonadota bacterium]|nr:MAG: hypothetical protein C4522_13475 [Desulfobacteraceae bacterium]